MKKKMKKERGGNAKFPWLASLSEEGIIHYQENIKEA